MEDVGISYGHFVYFTAIWHILWPFGKFYGYSVHFSSFGTLYQEKSGNPAENQRIAKSSNRSKIDFKFYNLQTGLPDGLFSNQKYHLG
jgi:hypothetical protein